MGQLRGQVLTVVDTVVVVVVGGGGWLTTTICSKIPRDDGSVFSSALGD